LTRFIGLTGGIGAGKSEALAAFERAGAAILSTDSVAHEVLDSDEVRAALIERWGEDVAPNGVVDRDRVAERVFGRPDELRWLESLTHPRVAAAVAEWRAGIPAGVGVAVVEVPLLFEAGMEGAFDAIVAVVAGDPVREARLAERGHAGLEGREERQIGQEEKADRAHHVIRNDGTLEELRRNVEAIMEELSPKAAR
jgi:dephospho-CoA kinase